MRLQKQLSRKVGDTKYNKFVVTIPPKEVKKLGWKEGQELDIEVKGKQAKIRPK